MKFQFALHMKVCARSNKDHKGVVVEMDGDLPRIQWNHYSQPFWDEDNDAMPDTPEAHAQVAQLTAQVQSKVDEATGLLEQAFKAWQEAASLQAGRETGSSEAYYLRGNPDLDLSKFEGICESNGWSTSSLYC